MQRHLFITDVFILIFFQDLLTIVGILETHSFGNPGAVHPEHRDLTQAMDKHEKAPKGFFLLTAGSTASVALYTSKQPRLSN
jgi:hypothetical protein